MADTYHRIRYALSRLAEKDSWNTIDLAESIREDSPIEFVEGKPTITCRSHLSAAFYA